jgi:hypothetical protein
VHAATSACTCLLRQPNLFEAGKRQWACESRLKSFAAASKTANATCSWPHRLQYTDMDRTEGQLKSHTPVVPYPSRNRIGSRLKAMEFSSCCFSYCPRICNKLAHEFASLGCKLPGGVQTTWDIVPQSLEDLVSSDLAVTGE